MPDAGLPRRTLLTSAWLTALAAVVAAGYGRWDLALGMTAGAAVSALSLWTLVVSVPRIVAPGVRAPRTALGVVYLMKLPVYALLLNWAVASAYVDPVAVFAGAGLVPGVLVLKVIGHLATPAARRAASPVGDDACPTTSTTSKQ